MAEPDDFKPICEIVAEGGRRYMSGLAERIPHHMNEVMYKVTQRALRAPSRGSGREHRDLRVSR